MSSSWLFHIKWRNIASNNISARSSKDLTAFTVLFVYAVVLLTFVFNFPEWTTEVINKSPPGAVSFYNPLTKWPAFSLRFPSMFD